MLNNELKVAARKGKKRIGRGGKRGTTSGRGTKGQGAHNKHKPDLFEGGRSSLLKRLKKVRGFKSPRAKQVTVTLTQLERVYTDGETVSLTTLFEKKLIPVIAKRTGAKIVRTGALTKKLKLGEGVSASEEAGKLFQ